VKNKILAELRHPGVIKLHQTFQDKLKLYFLVELAPNGELFTYMKNEGTIEYKEAQFLIAEIVNMLEYLQDNNISHRDIKPANLLFDSRMHLKLIDFGSGKFINSDEQYENRNLEGKQSGSSDDNQSKLKRMNTFIGTLEYMSPEIISGKCIRNE